MTNNNNHRYTIHIELGSVKKNRKQYAIHISKKPTKPQMQPYVTQEKFPYPHSSMEIYNAQQKHYRTLHTSRLRNRYKPFKSEQLKHSYKSKPNVV